MSNTEPPDAAGPSPHSAAGAPSGEPLRASEVLPSPWAPRVVPNESVDEVTPHDALRVLDLAMRFGELLVASGAPANDTVVQVLRLCAAYGMSSVYVDVTHGAISMSYNRGYDREPLTNMRPVIERGVDYTALQRLERLIVDIERERPALAEINDRLIAVAHGGPPYPAWFSMAGTGLVCVGASMLFGAPWTVMVIAFLLGCIVHRLIRLLDDHHVPAFFVQAAGALTFVIGASAAGVLGRHITLLRGVAPDLVLGSVIVMLVVGILAVAAIEDAIDEFYVTAAARLVEVIMLSSGLVVGIVVGLRIVSGLGVEVPVSIGGLPHGPIWMQLVGAFLLASMYSVETASGWRVISLSGVTALVGWILHLGAQHVGLDDISSAGIAALFASYAAAPLGRAARVPIIALVSSAIVPLVPGKMIVNALQQLAFADSLGALLTGFATLNTALILGLAIAVGAMLGIYLGRKDRFSVALAQHGGRAIRRVLPRTAAPGAPLAVVRDVVARDEGVSMGGAGHRRAGR